MYIITSYVHNKTFVNFKLRWTSREKYLVTNVCYNEQHSAFSGWEFLVPVSLILSVPVTAGEVTTGLITRVTWLRSGSRCRDNGRGKPRRLRGRHTTPGQMRAITVFRERYFPSLNILSMSLSLRWAWWVVGGNSYRFDITLYPYPWWMPISCLFELNIEQWCVKINK